MQHLFLEIWIQGRLDDCFHIMLNFSLIRLISQILKIPLLDLDLSITNGIVSTKIYDKRDDFNAEIVNFSFLDGDVPRSPSYGVYISQRIRFARVCSNVNDFNNRNTFWLLSYKNKVIDTINFVKLFFLILLPTLRVDCLNAIFAYDSSVTRHIRTCILRWFSL